MAEAAQKVAESIEHLGSEMPTLVLQHQPPAVATTFYPSTKPLPNGNANPGHPPLAAISPPSPRGALELLIETIPKAKSLLA